MILEFGSTFVYKWADILLVWILYQCWLLHLNCLAFILKCGKISTIQIGWNYSQLNIRTKFCHVFRRTFLLYLNVSMMDLMMEREITYIEITVLYLSTLHLKIVSNFLRHSIWVSYTFLMVFTKPQLFSFFQRVHHSDAVLIWTRILKYRVWKILVWWTGIFV